MLTCNGKKEAVLSNLHLEASVALHLSGVLGIMNVLTTLKVASREWD